MASYCIAITFFRITPFLYKGQPSTLAQHKSPKSECFRKQTPFKLLPGVWEYCNVYICVFRGEVLIADGKVSMLPWSRGSRNETRAHPIPDIAALTTAQDDATDARPVPSATLKWGVNWVVAVGRLLRHLPCALPPDRFIGNTNKLRSRPLSAL
jgi:hypothetical protein